MSPTAGRTGHPARRAVLELAGLTLGDPVDRAGDAKPVGIAGVRPDQRPDPVPHLGDPVARVIGVAQHDPGNPIGATARARLLPGRSGRAQWQRMSPESSSVDAFAPVFAVQYSKCARLGYSVSLSAPHWVFCRKSELGLLVCQL